MTATEAVMTQFAEDVKAYRHYAAEFDAPIRCELLYGDAYLAVARIASQFRVARSYPRRFDIDLGLARYGPLVTTLQSYLPDGTRDPVLAVLDLSRDLKLKYQKEDISAASKFLWFLWGRDILIYDSRSLATLQQRFPNFRPKDYHAYCSAWVSLFTECAGEIAEECIRQGASHERWFHERVFDWHLWRSAK